MRPTGWTGQGGDGAAGPALAGSAAATTAPATTAPATTAPASTTAASTTLASTAPASTTADTTAADTTATDKTDTTATDKPAAASSGRAASSGQAAAPGGAAVPGPLPARWSIPAAVAGGLALAAAFPPAGIWPLAAAGPALLAVALWRSRLRRALVTGLVFGAAFFFPLLAWLVNLAWYVWTGLAVAETLIFAVLALGQWLLLRLRAWPAAVACWWVAAEAIRDRWPFGGFPWGRLAMSQAAAPTARWVAVGGPPLLTFLLALAGGCLAWLLLTLAPGTGRRRRVLAAAALAAAACLALAGRLLPVDGQQPGTPTAVVAAVQGNVPHTRNLPDLLRAQTVTQNHATATDRLAARVRSGAAPRPAVVIWPENSTDIDPSYSPLTYQTIMSAVRAINSPVLVGALLADPVRNSGELWLPGRGPVAVYIKRRLVPFGEVIPFRGLLETFTSLPKLQPVNFTPGHRAVVFRVGRIRLGDVICYEVGFDNLVSSEVSAGANLLSVQTNDADFELDGQTGETLQQLDMARLRAIEFDRSVVVASTTGVSAIIAPDGSLIASTGTWTQAELDARVPLRAGVTLAGRAGAWPEGALTLAALAGMAWLAWTAAGQARQRRRSQGRPG